MHTKVCLKNIAKFASLAVAALTLNTASADVILELDLLTPNKVTVRATTGVAQIDHTLGWLAGFTLKGTTITSSASGFNAESNTLGLYGYPAPSGGVRPFRVSATSELNIYANGTGGQSFTNNVQAFSGEVTWTWASTDIYNQLLGSANGGDVWASWDSTDDPVNIIGQWSLITQSSASVPDSSSTLALLSLSLLGLFAVKRNQLSKAGSVSFSKA